MNDDELMGDRIRMLRQAKGWSLEELADRVGVSKGAVWQWEKGHTKNIKNPTFLALQRELGATQEFLLNGPDSPKSQGSGGRQHKQS